MTLSLERSPADDASPPEVLPGSGEAMSFLINDATPDQLEAFYSFDDTQYGASKATPESLLEYRYPDVISYGSFGRSLVIARYNPCDTEDRFYVATHQLESGETMVHDVESSSYDMPFDRSAQRDLHLYLKLAGGVAIHLSNQASDITTTQGNFPLNSAHLLRQYVQYQHHIE